MTLPTIEELLTIPTLEAILEGEVLAVLKAAGVRVTDWVTGGPYNTLAVGVSNLWLEGRTALAAMTAGRFDDYVFGLAEAPGGLDVTSFARRFAKQSYNVDAIEATHTKRRIVIANTTGSTYGPIADGRLILQFTATGNRYVNDGPVTIAPSGNTVATFRSEYAVDSAAGRTYIDGSGAAINLVSAGYAGVTAANPAPLISDVAVVGGGTGTFAVTGTPAFAATFEIRIDSPGNVGGGAMSVRQGGGAWAPAGVIDTLDDYGGNGVTITPADNGGSPAFPANAIFTFTMPGTDRLVVGRDAETPQELGRRCRGVYPLIGAPRTAAGFPIPLSPTLSGYEALARSASDEVKVCFVLTDPAINNKVRIYVAGQGALLSAATVGALQNFFNSLAMLTDWPVLASPTERAISLGGATIKIKSSLLATGQQWLQKAIAAYLGGVDAKTPLVVNGLIDRSYLNALLRGAPGVTHVDDGLTINTVAADRQLPVTPGAYELATWVQNVANIFTWVTV